MQENRKLLNDIIQRNYIKYFQAGNQKQFSLVLNHGAICCTNCAIDANYSDDDINVGINNFDTNLDICLDWYINNKCKCDINIIGKDDIELYNKTLDKILEKCGKGQSALTAVHVCTNGEFLNGDKIDNYIKLFTESNIQLLFTIYVKDKIIVKNNILPCIEKVITYITPDNINEWGERYQWWLTEAQPELYDKLTILEANKGWTPQTIEQFQIFYNYYLFVNSKLLYSDNLTDYIINHELSNNGWTENTDYIPCDLQKQLCIYVPNNRLLICPGLTDELMSIGYLTNNGDFDEENVALNVIKDHIKIGTLPRCEVCPCVGTCRTGCWAESFQSHGNILVACPEYCTLQKTKMAILLKFIIDNQLWSQIENDSNISIYYREYLRMQIKKIAGVEDENNG